MMVRIVAGRKDMFRDVRLDGIDGVFDRWRGWVEEIFGERYGIDR
jgi:hypothetical protein